MKFGRASEWHRQKYGRDTSQTPWRKMHLSIDPEMNIRQIAITEDHVSDEAGLDAVLTVDVNVDCVIADGAYCSIAQPQAWSACGVLARPSHSVPQGQGHPCIPEKIRVWSARWSSRRSRVSSAASARDC
ncbi:transposase [Burkholderia sp. GS2Y]|uniref:Transposase n=1 Tax=Burkholderia theae TaxID=3143496 RepID=A0ABU9WMI2_9BURK